MMFVSHATAPEAPRYPASPASFAGRAQAIDFGNPHLRSAIEHAMREALGSACTLDVIIDEDILAFESDAEALRDALAAIARDARIALGGRGVLHLCVLNVFDRCGGPRDQVLIVLSFAARFDTIAHPAAGSGPWLAARLAAAVDAEYEVLDNARNGTILSLLHAAE